MAAPCSVVGAPRFTTVSSLSALAAAINTARAGAVITLDTPVSGGTLTISRQNPFNPPITVVLPPTANFILVMAAAQGIDIRGGTFENLGVGLADYAAQVNGGARITFRGVRFAEGANCLTIRDSNGNETGTWPTDIVVSNCTFEYAQRDCVQSVAVTRLAVDGCLFRTPIKGQKFRFYNDGTSPQEAVPIIVGQLGHEDTSHNDAWQARGGTIDFTFTNNNAIFAGAGVVNFGTTGPNSTDAGELLTRALIAGNAMFTVDQNQIVLGGRHVEIRDNTFGPSPDDPAASDLPPFLRYIRIGGNAANGPFRGGRNVALSAPGGSPITGGFTAIDNWGGPNIAVGPGNGANLASATINGDVVDPPAAPRIVPAPWAPAPPSAPPTPSGVAGVPINSQTAGGPVVVRVWTDGPGGGLSASGPNWLNCNKRKWKYSEGATFEYRWVRGGTVTNGVRTGGTVIPGSEGVGLDFAKYQIQAADIGQNIYCEVRGTNAVGTGAWWTSNTPVVPIP